MSNNIFVDVLSPKTLKLTKLLQGKPQLLKDFYLSGGTGLALQLDHRESEDLDFFTPTPFIAQKLEQALLTIGRLNETELSKGTLNTFLEGVKLQFLEYKYSILEPFVNWDGIKISSVLDIACTKLQTVSMRRSKKDFVDLYFLLKTYTLPELLAASKRKYASSDYNETHILKSLVYFDDAEDQPMPRMRKDVDWPLIKKTITEAVKHTPLV